MLILKYGSDPLKTYLPDSDIDITLIVNNNFEVLSSDADGFIESQTMYLNALAQLKLIKDFLEEYQAMASELIGDKLDDIQNKDVAIKDFLNMASTRKESSFQPLSPSALHKHLEKDSKCIINSLLKQH